MHLACHFHANCYFIFRAKILLDGLVNEWKRDNPPPEPVAVLNSKRNTALMNSIQRML